MGRRRSPQLPSHSLLLVTDTRVELIHSFPMNTNSFCRTWMKLHILNDVVGCTHTHGVFTPRPTKYRLRCLRIWGTNLSTIWLKKKVHFSPPVCLDCVWPTVTDLLVNLLFVTLTIFRIGGGKNTRNVREKERERESSALDINLSDVLSFNKPLRWLPSSPAPLYSTEHTIRKIHTAQPLIERPLYTASRTNVIGFSWKFEKSTWDFESFRIPTINRQGKKKNRTKSRVTGRAQWKNNAIWQQVKRWTWYCHMSFLLIYPWCERAACTKWVCEWVWGLLNATHCANTCCQVVNIVCVCEFVLLICVFIGLKKTEQKNIHPHISEAVVIIWSW